MSNKIHNIRRDHSINSLIIQNNENPVLEVKAWLEEALSKDIQDANAMVLCTVDTNNCPSSRIVLARDITPKGIVFYTNYLSDKAKDIANNPNVSLNLYWKEIDKQIKLKGTVKKVSKGVSDKYFAGRPRESQIGAWASYQSQKTNNYHQIIERFEEEKYRFEGKEIKRPPHWGGFIVEPFEIQFWKGKPSRLHENICFEKNSSGKWERHFKNP
jgi:pyridoxamine 5'-phosphate oxidase